MPASVPSVPSIKGKGKLGIGIRAPIASAGGIYRQPDGTSRYLRPDGTSIYTRP